MYHCMQVPPDLTKEKAEQWCANLAELDGEQELEHKQRSAPYNASTLPEKYFIRLKRTIKRISGPN